MCALFTASLLCSLSNCTLLILKLTWLCFKSQCVLFFFFKNSLNESTPRQYLYCTIWKEYEYACPRTGNYSIAFPDWCFSSHKNVHYWNIVKYYYWPINKKLQFSRFNLYNSLKSKGNFPFVKCLILLIPELLLDTIEHTLIYITFKLIIQWLFIKHPVYL